MNKSNTTDYNGVCRFLNYQIEKQRKDLKLTQLDFLKEKNISPILFRRIKAVAEGDTRSSYSKKQGNISTNLLIFVGSQIGFKIDLDTNYSISHED